MKWKEWENQTRPVKLNIYEDGSGFEVVSITPGGELRVILYVNEDKVRLSPRGMEAVGLTKDVDA